MLHRLAPITLIGLIVVGGLVGSGAMIAPASSENEYVVKDGETLGEISIARGVSMETLMTLNAIEDPDAIKAGQVLKLPPKPPPVGAPRPASSPSAAREYTVRAGDTLTSIAKAVGVSSRALADANGIADPDRVVAGQRLKLPSPVARSEAVSAKPSPPPSVDRSDPAAIELLERLASMYGIDPALVKAMAWIDNGGKGLPTSNPRWLGQLQLADTTFDEVAQSRVKRALDKAIPADNAEAAVAYASSIVRWSGDDAMGLAAFIQGPGSVQRDGVRPATEQRVRAILALRDQVAQRSTSPTELVAPIASPQAAFLSNSITSLSGALSDRTTAAARAVAGTKGRIGVAGRDLVTGQRLATLADQVFPCASVGKLAIMLEVYRQVELGGRTMTDATRDDLERMITLSDNDAANRLFDLVGAPAVNATVASLGLTKTKIVNHFGTDVGPNRPFNQTTAADMSRVVELIANDQAVSAAASKAMRVLMLGATDGTKMRRGLPQEASLAHKSGWFDAVANDVGIIYHARGSYVLAVLTEDLESPEVANDTIAAITRTVNEAWGSR